MIQQINGVSYPADAVITKGETLFPRIDVDAED